jgi:hypothetical protein
MSTLIDPLLFVWRKNAKRAQDLFANIPDERLVDQSHGLVNHPAWSLSHLMLYHPAIVALARGEAVPDPNQEPGADRCANGTKPVADPALYPKRRELIARFVQGHAQIDAALAADVPEVFLREPGLERWKTSFGTTGNALFYLMLWHESHHLAEIADWKKVEGIPVVG